MLALGAHALRGVDCEGVAEAEQEPPGLRVREPLPVDLGRLTARVAQDEAGGRLSDHLDDVAVVADRGALAVDLGDGFPVHAQPISGRDGQVEEFSLLGPIDDRLVGRLVRPDLAAGFETLADRPADVGRLGVGERGDRHPVARVLGFERVVALDVEVGDLPHHLVGVALEESPPFRPRASSRGLFPLCRRGRGRRSCGRGRSSGGQRSAPRAWRTSAERVSGARSCRPPRSTAPVPGRRAS